VAYDQEVEFPHIELARLDEMINRPRWVVPVLHNGELEVLLDASIALCKKGQRSDEQQLVIIICELCLQVSKNNPLFPPSHIITFMSTHPSWRKSSPARDYKCLD